MELGLSGRVYILTGASQGLGYACAQQLVAENAQVILCSRNPTRLQQAVETLGGPTKAHAIPGDLADPELPTKLVTAAHQKYGRLDGALLSVGGPPAGTAMETPDETWRTAFEQVFLGALRTSRTIAEHLGNQDQPNPTSGSIVLVLSSSVRSPIGNLAVSNGLRPGLAMIAKTLADELGPRHIRVNSVLPGSINTERLRQLQSGNLSNANRLAGIPLGRIGEPAEFAKPAVFLLSPAASYITGTTLMIDGGAARTL